MLQSFVGRPGDVGKASNVWLVGRASDFWNVSDVRLSTCCWRVEV